MAGDECCNGRPHRRISNLIVHHHGRIDRIFRGNIFQRARKWVYESIERQPLVFVRSPPGYDPVAEWERYITEGVLVKKWIGDAEGAAVRDLEGLSVVFMGWSREWESLRSYIVDYKAALVR